MHDTACLNSDCLTCWCRRNHLNSILYLLLQFLDTTDLWNIKTVDFRCPQRQKFKWFKSWEGAGHTVSPPCLIYSRKTFKNCQTAKIKCDGAVSCMSHIWTLVCRSTSWSSFGRNICRKLCYRAPLRIGGSRVPVEQKGSTDYHYNLWLTVCFTMRYHQWKVPEVLFPALTAWKFKMDTFSPFSWIFRRL